MIAVKGFPTDVLSRGAAQPSLWAPEPFPALEHPLPPENRSPAETLLCRNHGRCALPATHRRRAPAIRSVIHSRLVPRGGVNANRTAFLARAVRLEIRQRCGCP